MNLESAQKPENFKFKIEPAKSENLPDIQALNKKLFDYEIENGFDSNIDPNWSYSEEGEKELRERLTAKDSIGFISKINGEIKGYLIGLIREEETGRLDSRYVELEHMFVDLDERGNGMGENLVKEFKAWAKEKGLKRIKVIVSFDNKKAIEFYKKVGLVPADLTMSGEIE